MSQCQDFLGFWTVGDIAAWFGCKNLLQVKVKLFKFLNPNFSEKKDIISICHVDENASFVFLESLFPRPCLCVKAMAGVWFISPPRCD